MKWKHYLLIEFKKYFWCFNENYFNKNWEFCVLKSRIRRKSCLRFCSVTFHIESGDVICWAGFSKVSKLRRLQQISEIESQSEKKSRPRNRIENLNSGKNNIFVSTNCFSVFPQNWFLCFQMDRQSKQSNSFDLQIYQDQVNKYIHVRHSVSKVIFCPTRLKRLPV